MRKIIQILKVSDVLFALCDDGTAWFYENKTWEQLPYVPQDDPIKPIPTGETRG